MTLSLPNDIPQGPAAAAAPEKPAFAGILFDAGDQRRKAELAEPDCFHDLNLDLIVKAVTAGREEYKLESFFYAPLTDPAVIRHRHAIMADVDRGELFQALKAFSAEMRIMRNHLAALEKLSFHYEKERWLVDAVIIYGDAVEKLRADLRQHGPTSEGLQAFLGYLDAYAESAGFKALLAEARKLTSDLSAIRYGLLIHGDCISVRRYNGEADYGATIEEVFARFRHGAVKDYRVKQPIYSGLNHVEAQALDLVARLNPEVFQALDAFFASHRTFSESVLADFDREIQFYLAYSEFMARFRGAGLKFCYPEVSDSSKSVASREGYDLALARKLVQDAGRESLNPAAEPAPERKERPVVCNDFTLSGPERILVVTGPNQGGKTTFARMFGQIHYLASLGCPVAGSEAKVFLADRLFTHFEREEDITTLHGKLQDDLVRMHRILAEATPKSVIIINEIFSSTSLQDAIYLGRKAIGRIAEMDLIAVCVTFIDELASLNEKTVSMVATIVPDNPTLRTHRIERKPADGLSYAVALAEKYRLTYDRLKERMRS